MSKRTISLIKILWLGFLVINGLSEINAKDNGNDSSSSTALVPYHQQPTAIETLPSSGTTLPKLESIDSSLMPFQIGFEFQEISSLCPWAKNMEGIDKKELFSVHLKNNPSPLWHVEIDDVDIEFVTPPFKPHEKEKLAIAIESIQMAIHTLQTELNTNKKTSLSKWVNEIINTANDKDIEIVIIATPEYDRIADLKIKRPKPMNFPRVDHEKITGREVVLREEVHYWKPVFAPQVTIQHPLEDTIPLYFSLFGFKSQYMISFVSNLPFLDLYKENLQFADQDLMNQFIKIFRQKIHGLIFLHALTMTAMTPSDSDDDQLLIQETLMAWQYYRQIDPKVKLSLMSRRPFSEMYASLNQTNYAKYFQKVMKLNYEFIGFNKVPLYFNYTNYGEQFYDQYGHPLQNLQDVGRDILKKRFFKNNKPGLAKLLSEGIVTTTIIRNLINRITYKLDQHMGSLNQIFKLFYVASLDSVENPQLYPRLQFDPKKLTFRLEKSEYDSLSPPWLLHADNAMGFYKNVDSEIIKNYGEAIVEVRSISSVQPWFLKRAGLSEELTGSFLRYPSDDMVTQAVKLFDFLADFRSEKNMLEIFYLGLPYVVKSN